MGLFQYGSALFAPSLNHFRPKSLRFYGTSLAEVGIRKELQLCSDIFFYFFDSLSGSGCSKLMTPSANVSLKF